MTHDGTMTRREALAATLGGTAALTMGGTALGGRSFLSERELGWDAGQDAYTLPPLPYAYDALEPHIDEQTMRIHHDRHHAGYVKGLNAALDQLRSLRTSRDGATLQHWQRQLAFHAGGHVNHTLFWSGMSPEGGGEPGGPLREAIERDFGSFGDFAWQFKAAAGKVEGSGWGWLVYEPMGRRLLVGQMENQQKMLFAGAVPLLGVDVWEHAYYLKYQNDRGAYVDAFMNVIDWAEIARRFDHARGATRST